MHQATSAVPSSESNDSGGGSSCSSSGTASPTSRHPLEEEENNSSSSSSKNFHQRHNNLSLLMPTLQQHLNRKQQKQQKQKQQNRCSKSASGMLPRLSPPLFSSRSRLQLRLAFLKVASSKFFSLLLTAALIFAIWRVWIWGLQRGQRTTVLVITPTYKRPERLADMTRFSQTLMHVPNLNWIVIEDATETVPAVERILERSGIPFTYFYGTTKPGFPRRGWTHRNLALDYVRKVYSNFGGNAVVYFADDDNTYDIRLFERFIKQVKTIGVWAVGMAGGARVETPRVNEKGSVIGWDVVYAPNRPFATDMAGFAINLQLILSSNTSFHEGCVKQTPETCFLSQFGIPLAKLEPFGVNSRPKEILVWHTKTAKYRLQGDSNGYVLEQ